MAPEARFTTLDGLRGLAAILVMCFHAAPASPVRVAGGYLAVDIFFILSGFVLAMTYEPRLGSGLSASRFMVLRLTRLYPMYLVGTMFSLISGPALVTSMLMLPNLSFTGPLFPDNIPMWSLFYELLASAAFGLLALRCGTKGLMVTLAITGGLLLFQTLGLGKSMVRGPDWPDLAVGLTRTAFSFTLGVAIYRWRKRQGLVRKATWLSALPFIALLGTLIAAPADRQYWDIVCVFVILPCIAWLGTMWEMPIPKLGTALGDLSYPLYCIHAPIIWGGLYGLPNMASLFAIVIALAWSLDRWVDQPVRQVLKQRLRATAAKPALA
jgi:peptidoglycan/LPS O-acetylase OafA/YrhL